MTAHIVNIARFKRDIHTNENFREAFEQAFDCFKQDVALWSATTGIEFQTEFGLAYCTQYDCDVTVVNAVFDSETELAMYNMHMPNPVVATDITKSDQTDKLEFSRWVPANRLTRTPLKHTRNEKSTVS